MNKPQYLYLNSRDEFYRIDVSRIVYFESDGNYTNVILSNGLKATVCMNLATMQQVLSTSLKENATAFARIGKRFIINLNHVYHIAILRQKLVLSDGDRFEYTLSISKEALKGLREIYIAGKSKIKAAPKASVKSTVQNEMPVTA